MPQFAWQPPPALPKSARQPGANVNYQKPTHAEIDALARQIWKDSGCAEGHDVENWLKAEKILTGN